MPIYGFVVTPADLETTLPNHIRDGNPNPFLEPVLEEDSVWITQIEDSPVVGRLLIPQDNLSNGEADNYARPYYRNVFSAPTTAGYTQIRQVTFTRHTGMITGYQIGLPQRG